jgi:membrane protease subunit (stomatin/prohibitin family)
MALIDRIKFDGLARDWIIYRYPGESFVMGTQLIVGEGQVAVFVKSGQALDFFTAGSHTLSSANIPLLQKLINLPFGGKTPFTAEVYFINKTAKLDINWGTIDPIQVIDPKYFIKLRVRAFGQFGMRVEDYRVFLTELIGAMNEHEVVNYGKILNYFKGVLVTKVKALIAQAIIVKKISALEISAHIDDISDFSKQQVSEEFRRFGLKVVNFFIQSINFPDEDFTEINKILQDKAAFDIIGDQRYASKRSFDVLDAAASNQSGGATGAFIGAGVGIGAGLGIGSAVGNLAGNLNTAPAAPGGAAAPSVPAVPAQTACPECGKPNEPDAAFCGHCGKRLAVEKPKCPECGKILDPDIKFCTGCGAKIIKSMICPNCQTENALDTRFCKECGTKLEGST